MQSVVSRQKRKDALEGGSALSDSGSKSSPGTPRWSGGASPSAGKKGSPTVSHGKKRVEPPSASKVTDSFDPQALLTAFDEALVELNSLSERVERRVDKLMKVIQKEEVETKAAVGSVEKSVEV